MVVASREWKQHINGPALGPYYSCKATSTDSCTVQYSTGVCTGGFAGIIGPQGRAVNVLFPLPACHHHCLSFLEFVKITSLQCSHSPDDPLGLVSTSLLAQGRDSQVHFWAAGQLVDSLPLSSRTVHC